MSSQQGIVIHSTTGESSEWRMALRNILNLQTAESVPTAPDQMKVVVDGDAARFLLDSSPDAAKRTRMADASVHVNCCEQSLDRLGHSPDDLAEGVETIGPGVAEVLRIQQHPPETAVAGRASVRLPAAPQSERLFAVGRHFDATVGGEAPLSPDSRGL